MKKLLPVVIVILFSSYALAGVRYTLHLETLHAGTRSEVVQNAWLQGSQAKLLFDEGVTSQQEIDADRFGAVAFRVDPNTGRTTKLAIGTTGDGVTRQGIVKNIVTTKTLQEAGPVMLGHPTTHFRFTSEFDYTANGDTRHGSMTHELWVAQDIGDFDLMNWMMFEYRLRQDQGFESLFREVSTQGGGLPLAYDGIALVDDGDGNTQVVRLSATVDSLEMVNVDPSVFTAASNTYEVVAGGQ